MYNGKYRASAKKTRKRIPALLISLVLLVLVTVGGVVAYLMDTSLSVTNTFKPAEVVITINESTTETTKSNITFTNPSLEENPNVVPVYIRATLEIYWMDSIEGAERIMAMPANAVDFGAGVLTQNGWFKVGDIYYYSKVVKPGETTAVMADTIKVTLPDGSAGKCVINVRAEAIQAEPTNAVLAAWGTDVKVNSDGTLAAK